MSKLVLNNENVILDIDENIVFAKSGYPEVDGLVECSQAEATHIWNKTRNSAFMNRDMTLVDATVPEGIVERQYKYINGEFVLNVEERRRAIIAELEELDATINRATEDLYTFTSTSPYSSLAEVISRKEALRAELATL